MGRPTEPQKYCVELLALLAGHWRSWDLDEIVVGAEKRLALYSNGAVEIIGALCDQST